MPIHKIPYRETGYFSQLICDYLDENEQVKPFYHRFQKIEDFKAQIEEKSNFPQENREVLVSVLQKQYKDLEAAETLAKVELLANSNTFTVTTGHQLNLFTGPLYFLYKIIDTITLSRKLKTQYPECDFVPVYWMATEDHDFDEINHFRLHGKNFAWNKAGVEDNDKGAVGHFDTEGLQAVYEQFCAELGSTDRAKKLCELFENAYLKHENLAEATRYLAHQLFGKYGLVIIDADDHDLKKLFIPQMKAELTANDSHEVVTSSTKKLEEAGYNSQVHPREINLFYQDNELRERIVKQDGKYFVNATQLEFTEEELLTELENSPEKFSPNVIMRPMYQEVILPNLCYIGGGGELAYWLQLKANFERAEVPFPILILRNSVLLITEKQFAKAEKLGISIKDMFLPQNDLVNQKIRKISNIDIDFTEQKKHLVKQFQEMYALAEQTDKSFLGAVKAQEVKQLKGLDHLEKRLLKAQKRKLGDHIKRMTDLQNELFPSSNLQERVMNFSEFYMEYGEDLIPMLLDNLNPLEDGFTVMVV